VSTTGSAPSSDVHTAQAAADPSPQRRGLVVVTHGSWGWRLLVGGGTALAFGVVAVLPFLLPILEARLVSRFVALGVALLGLQFVVGRAGQLSLCHGVFVGIGSYGTTIALSTFGLPHLAALGLAPVLGFVFGCLVGLLGLRIRAIYLGPVTLSVAVVFPMFVKRFGWFTGGSSGLPIKRELTPPAFLGFESSEYYLWTHLVIVAVAVVAVVVVRNVVLSPVGLAVRATAENPLSAATSGIDVRRTRVVAYGFGAAVGALGGGLLVLDTPIVGADSYDLFRSLGYYAAVMVGGAVSMIGAALGALILVGVPRLMVVYDLRTGPNLILGLLLVVSTLLTPGGLSVPLRRVAERLVVIRRTSGRD
jgi:branched-chain amino acid transport system permease protein